jgi:hypothetical protein
MSTTRKTFDPDDETVLPPHGEMPATEQRLPCRFCGTSTLRPILVQYGARCYRCYVAYCEEPPTRRGLIAGDKRQGAKAWAWALKASEERDPASVTAKQRVEWRAALASELSRQRTIDEELAS